MFTHQHKIRVSYGDTDQMGYVYYGNYAHYYEQARSEAIRSLGVTYKQIEQSGIIMPITRMNTKYIGPAFYDDLLTIKTIIPFLPDRLILFQYKIYNEDQKLINEGETQLVFLTSNDKKIAHAPNLLIDRLQIYFTN